MSGQVHATSRAVPLHPDFPELMRGIEGVLWEADARTFAFTYVSPQSRAILGYEPEEWLASPTFWADHLHPADRPWAVEFCAAQTGESRDHEFEYRMLAKDGRVVWVRDLVWVVRDAEGKAARLRGLLTDVTRRKNAEQRLAIQLDVTNILSAAAGADDAVPAVLDAIARRLGLPLMAWWRADPAGLRCAHASAAAPAYEAFAAATRGARLARGEALPGRAAQAGAPLWSADAAADGAFARAEDARAAGLRACVAVPIKAARRVLGVLEFAGPDAVAPDAEALAALEAAGAQLGLFLERRAAEEELREREHRYRQILDSVQDMVFTKDADARILYANKATCDYYGMTLDELRGLDAADAADDRAVFETGRTVEAEEEPNRRADGQTRYFHTLKSPIKDTSGRVVEVVGVSRDVTQRREEAGRVQELLREVEAQRARLDAIVASVPGVVWEAWGEPDAQSQRIDFVSGYVEPMLGYTREEWLSTPNFWLSIVHPEDREAAARESAAHFQGGRGGTLRFRWVRKDGSVLWAQAWNVVIKDAEGRPVGMRGVTMDVTPLREAERATRLSDERFRILARATNDTIWDWDLATDEVWWNENFTRTFGYPREDVEPTAESWTRRVHPEDLPRVKEAIVAAIEGTATTWSDEYRFRRKDGRYADILDRGFIIRDARGKAIRMLGSMMDVTERRAAERELHRVRHDLELILDSAGEGVYGVDQDGRTTFMNAAALRMLGLQKDEAVGRALHDVIHHSRPDGAPYPAAECPIHQTAQGGPGALVKDDVFFRRDGAAFPVEYVTTPLTDGGRVVGAVTVFKDVTQRRRAEQEVRDARERLDIALKAAALGAWDLDLETDRAVRSARHDEIFGYGEPVAEWGAQRFLGHVVPEHRAQVRAAFDEAYRSGRLAFECRIQRADGEPAWISVQGVVVHQDGRPVRMLGVVADVTERRRAEDAVQKERRLLSAVLQQLPAGVIIAGMPSGKLILANERVNQILAHEFIPGAGMEQYAQYAVLAPDGRPLGLEEYPLVRALTSGETVIGEEVAYQRRDGTLVPLLVNAAPVRDEAGTIVAGVVAFVDISERKRGERRLLDREERLRAALDASATGTFRWDLATNALDWDDNLDRLFGLPPGQTARHLDQFTRLVHPDDRAGVFAALERCVGEGADFDMEFRVVWPDGTVRWLLDRGSMVRDAAGRPVYMAGACTDVTERKRTEEEVRRHADLLAWQRRVLESIAEAAPLHETLDVLCREAESQAEDHHFTVLLVDEDGQRLRHGAAPSLPDHYTKAVDGIPIGEGVGSCGTAAHRKAPVVVGDIATDPLWKDFRDLALSAGLRACWSTPIVASDGRLLGTWAVYRTTPGDPEPMDAVIVAVATRLAAVAIERARAEEEIRYQRDLTKTITDNTGAALFMMDLRGHPVFLNPAALAMTGYASLDEVKDRPLHDAIHFRRPDGSPYPREECPIDRANAEVRPLRNQREVFCRRDGGLFPVEYNVAPVEKDGEPAGVVVEVRDITEQLRAETQLRQRAEELARLADAVQRTNRELDQFAYITSHDLKAPLRGIANLSRWIEEDAGERLSDEARGHLELLRGRVNRMESLIDALLAYSRAGRVKGKPERVDVGDLLRETIDLASPPPEFRVEASNDLPTLVADRTRLQQVFLNLIGNAVKHHHRKDGVVRVTWEDAGDMLRFAVADDGPGIDPRFHDRIFLIFQTLQPRDKVEGTGVGLALVKKIVESHGGTVTVESEEGKGATFRFTWPKLTKGD